MTITRLAGRRALAQSTDAKPANYPVGYKILELDTGRQYMFDGKNWIFIKRLWDTRSKLKQGAKTSICQLFGDTFAKTALTRGYLLEDLNDDGGTNALTNNNSIDLTRVEDKIPLRGFLVPTFDGVNQFFSRATEAEIEVGTNSFLAGIWFKTTLESTVQGMIQYGDRAASQENWGIQFDAAGNLFCEIDDGTTRNPISDSIANRYADGKWHIVMMFVDRNTNTMYLLVGDDPSNLTLVGTAAVTSGDLTHATQGLLIGARFQSSATSHFTGELSNFFLYDMGAAGSEDYNLPAILAAGIRESATKGDTTIGSATTNRLNSQFFNNDNNDSDFTFSVIYTDEGYYDMIALWSDGNNRGIVEISIDGRLIRSRDQFNSSFVSNIKTEDKGIFLHEGFHLIKILVNGKNASSSDFFYAIQMIELIKRDGSNEGGATSFTLFGDEIQERNNSTWNFVTRAAAIFNNQVAQASIADGNFSEGTIYLKKGLWKITYTFERFSTFGKCDLDFGGVEVLDQEDQYNATIQENQQVTKFVRLDGGKTNVRLAVNGKNGASSNFAIEYQSIRGELVSGTGYGDKVTIWGADADFETVSGVDADIFIDTGQRFNFRFRVASASDALNDENLYRRYFSGGTYRVKYHYTTSTAGGLLDIGIDSNATAIADNLDQHSDPLANNQEYFTIVEITRGFHDIHLKNDGAGTGGGFNWQVTFLQFELIARSTQLGDGPLEDNEDGSKVLLAQHIARKAETTTPTIEIADAQRTKYDHFILECNFEADAAQILECVLNGQVGTSNFTNGFHANGNTLTDINPSSGGGQAQLDLCSTNIASANNVFVEGWFKFRIPVAGGQVWQGTSLFSGEATPSFEQLAHLTNTGSPTQLSSILLKVSAGTWIAGSEFRLYGVKKP